MQIAGRDDAANPGGELQVTDCVMCQHQKDSFALASRQLPPGEPLDWVERPVPMKWKLNGRTTSFNWE